MIDTTNVALSKFKVICFVLTRGLSIINPPPLRAEFFYRQKAQLNILVSSAPHCRVDIEFNGIALLISKTWVFGLHSEKNMA